MQKLTEQHRHKISMAMKGRNLSEGHKAKLRVAMKGINTWTKELIKNGYILSSQCRAEEISQFKGALEALEGL